MRRTQIIPYLAALLVLATAAAAQEPSSPAQEEKKPRQGQDLAEMSIEDLLQLEVTTVSRKEQKLIETPSAVFVIRGEDIKRSGATSIAEALRMVPGLNVARLDSNKWAISARGFQDRFANKLLVMVDGRSAYTPLFSGVYWDAQFTMLADIDRIEVVRGPGATTWGANAVNGVINVITKSAKETQGMLATAGFGTEERGFGEARWGAKVGENLHYRAFARYRRTDDGHEGADDWWNARGGFRLDWDATTDDQVTLSGDWFNGGRHDRQTLPLLAPPFSQTFGQGTDVTGGNLNARWRRTFGASTHLEVQAWYDRTVRDSDLVDELRQTGDLSVQLRFPLAAGHDVVAGAGCRVTADSISDGPTVTFDPSHRSINWFSAFLQDEITLVDERLRLTLGSKFEYNSATQLEVQPSARALWTPHADHALWASVSRSARTPSRAEEDVTIDLRVTPGAPPVLSRVMGSRDFDSEQLVAWELGYRVKPLDTLSLDLALFYNEYDHLRSVEQGTPFFNPLPSPHVEVPFTFDNRLGGRTYGLELSTRWHALEWWHLQAAYSYLHMNLDLDSDSTDPSSERDERNSPRHQLYLRSTMDLPWDLHLDAMGRYVSTLRDVEAYVELDLRLAWTPGDRVEVAVVGQGLLHNHHREYFNSQLGSEPTEAERGVYVSVTVKW